MKKLLSALIILSALIWGKLYYMDKANAKYNKPPESKPARTAEPVILPTASATEESVTPSSSSDKLPKDDIPAISEKATSSFSQAPIKNGQISEDVPFIVQAPTGNWKDMRFQDGCEETASLMAVKWAMGEKAATSATALSQEILAIADYEKQKYGSYVDTSASTTAQRIIDGYFGYAGYKYEEKVSKNDIITELEKGNVVIAPTDGRALFNPYFTNGGPEEHMLLIKGYDYRMKEFITNDPGTRRGESYRYDEDILFDAIRDYPTGDHQPIIGTEKNVIIVYKDR